MSSDKVFDAEKEMLNFYTSLTRTKVTQILAVVGMLFVYFQIVLNENAKPFRTSIATIPHVNVTISLAHLGFLLLTFLFSWQFAGFLWYNRMEQMFFQITKSDIKKQECKMSTAPSSAEAKDNLKKLNKRMASPDHRSERPLLWVYHAVQEKSLKDRCGKFIHCFSIHLGNKDWQTKLGVIMVYALIIIVSFIFISYVLPAK